MAENDKDSSQPLSSSVPSLDTKSFRAEVADTLGMVSHISAIVLTGYVIYLAWPFPNLFSWHPVLMTLAFAFLMTEAILFFSPESSLVPKAQRPTKVNYHVATMIAAIVCGFSGFTIIYINKNNSNKDHFTSWHGTFGLIVVCYMCVQATGGVITRYPKLLASKLKPAKLKLYHATSGLFLFILVCATFVLALFSNWFVTNSSDLGWYISLMVIALLSLMVMNQVTTEYVPRAFKKPQQY